MELHSRALLNYYLLLDPTRWHVVSPGPSPESTDIVCDLIAEYADGIFYGSNATRWRFTTRFQSDPSVNHNVCYMSLHPADYVRHVSEPSCTDGYLLVVGQGPDDAGAAEVVELLATSFPFQSVQALNCGSMTQLTVTRIPADRLSERELARLYARARVVVLPSFDQAVGFSVVMGLSCGKAVVARHSKSLEEIAARCRADGRLFVFSDPLELMQIVARLLRGDELTGVPLGAALGEREEPIRWSDVAQNLLGFMGEELQACSGLQWWRRSRAFRARDCTA